MHGPDMIGFRIGLSNIYRKSLVLLSHGHSYLPVIFCLCEGCRCASQGMFEADDAKMCYGNVSCLKWWGGFLLKDKEEEVAAAVVVVVVKVLC